MLYPVLCTTDPATSTHRAKVIGCHLIEVSFSDLDEGVAQVREALIELLSRGDDILPGDVDSIEMSETDRVIYVEVDNASILENTAKSEKVTVTLPSVLLKKIDKTVESSVRFKSRSNFLLQSAQNMLTKISETRALSSMNQVLSIPNVFGLSELTPKDELYFIYKIAYIHKFIEDAKESKSNTITITLHNRTSDFNRIHSGIQYPFDGLVLFCNDWDLEFLFEKLKGVLNSKGFNVIKGELRRSGKIFHQRLDVTWDEDQKLITTDIETKKYTFSTRFVEDYLISLGVFFVDDKMSVPENLRLSSVL
ncbi:type II toxin-antitoxin system HicB family antitoxin [Morganella morganii]|uniref:Type II toxin-antitoxin system HicB family antitoxin n=1 Tax=Morganella morganii TaxID=582 RepID=A0AAI9MUX0_MORMO|nr:type II toxin-antitoxin system HicB family antitoxin [Morganella morganii]